MRQPVVSVVLATAILFGLPVLVHGPASLALGEPTPADLHIQTPAASPVAFPDVVDRTYTDRTYGYRLSWDDSWEISAVPATGGGFLQLSNGVSHVYVGAIAGVADPGDCLDAQVATRTGDPGLYRDVALAKGLDGRTMQLVATDRAFGVFTYTYAPRGSLPVAYAEYLECRALVPGSVALLFDDIVVLSAYNAQVPSLQALLDALVVPAVAPQATPPPTAE
jgi:hypothetical protein